MCKIVIWNQCQEGKQSNEQKKKKVVEIEERHQERIGYLPVFFIKKSNNFNVFVI